MSHGYGGEDEDTRKPGLQEKKYHNCDYNYYSQVFAIGFGQINAIGSVFVGDQFQGEHVRDKMAAVSLLAC